MTTSDALSQTAPTPTAEPRPDRPHLPEGYGVPATTDGMLPWAEALARVERATSYWVSTVDAKGRPQSRPIWGGVVNGTLYLEGSAETRWARNMAANPHISVHLESAREVVILEGTVARMVPDAAVATRLAESMRAKYADQDYQPESDSWDEGGLCVIQPRVAYAWTKFPSDVTRYHFDGD